MSPTSNSRQLRPRTDIRTVRTRRRRPGPARTTEPYEPRDRRHPRSPGASNLGNMDPSRGSTEARAPEEDPVSTKTNHTNPRDRRHPGSTPANGTHVPANKRTGTPSGEGVPVLRNYASPEVTPQGRSRHRSARVGRGSTRQPSRRTPRPDDRRPCRCSTAQGSQPAPRSGCPPRRRDA